MQNKMIGLLGLVLTGVVLTGCATSPKLTRLDDVASKEAITVARFRVLYNGKDVTKGCNVIFNNVQQCILDESGYVFVKLPIGTNSIRNVVHKSGLKQHHFRPDELTCQITGGGAINYIGDITFEWRGTKAITATAIGITAATGILGSIFLTPQGQVVVAVASEAPAAQAVFRQKFPTDRVITPALLVVTPHH